MSIQSLYNNTSTPLLVGESFVSQSELITNYAVINTYVATDKDTTVILQQSYNGNNWYNTNTYVIDTAVKELYVQSFCKNKYFRTIINNTSGQNQSYLNLSTKLTETAKTDLIDVSGSFDISGQTINIGSLPALSTGNNHIGNVDVSGLNFNNNLLEVASYGQNSNFNFYPTADNNTISIYADGRQGVNVPGGWSFLNTAVNKINWYIYQAPTAGGNPTTAGQTVASVKSMYAVINQQSTLGLAQAQNPWIMIYTIPDSGVNASWFKSKLFYGSNAHTDISGMKLLYTGIDPIDVHTEITGINRIKLDFNLALSTKSEAAAANELVGAGTLQTTANTPVGQFNFTMSQFGVDWLKVNSPLPIENGKVQVDTGVVITTESSPTGAVTNLLGNTGDLVSGVRSTLQSLNLSKIGGGGFAYVKIYNKATAPTATDTPVFTIPIQNNSIQQVECHSLNFPLGIGLRATLNFDPTDTNDPTGTIYGTAFYTNL